MAKVALLEECEHLYRIWSQTLKGAAQNRPLPDRLAGMR